MHRAPARAPPISPEHDPSSSRYWDERDLEQELRRTFQVCNECRMCVGYCGSFPILFEAIDREIESGRADGAETVTNATVQTVSDHCWQCKLCYIKCPYTPDEGAYEALDFPRLLAREKAQRARRRGIPLVDQVLGEPQLVGALGAGAPARVANLVNANRLVRKVAEKAFGISAEFPLPPLATQEAIEHELETYNELLPGERELSLTLFIEYQEREERERMLSALVGLEDKLALRVGAELLPVTPDPRARDPERTMAVHYLKVPLTEAALGVLLSGGAPVALEVAHAAYSAIAPLSAATLGSLRDDFG